MILEKKSLAPVLITSFNRDSHFCETLKALSENIEAKNTRLYISIDGWVTKEDKKKQQKILEFAKLYSGKFSSLNITQQPKNLGLSKNITESITNIINKHGKIIVLEDDVVVSRAFLKFMNDSLSYYEKKKKIWHIAAYNIFNDKKKLNEIFLWRIMNCWGWATWQDRWSHYEKNPEKLIRSFNKKKIDEFNLGSTNIFWDQIIDNFEGTIDTWAIFWYATIFQNSGLCVNPWFSYIRNIGLDGTGVHYKKNNSTNLIEDVNHNGVFVPQDILEENTNAVNIMKNHYKKQTMKMSSLLSRFLNKKIKRELKKFFNIK